MDLQEVFSPQLIDAECTTLGEYAPNEVVMSRPREIYIFHLTFKDVTWKVVKNYSDLVKFYKKIETKLLTRLPMKKKTKFLQLPASDKNAMLKNLFHEVNANVEICSNELLTDFLEVSALSFKGQTIKRKEGYIKKQTGGRVTNEKKLCNCGKYFKRFQKRWMIVRDTGVFVSKDKTCLKMSDVLMYDSKFSILFSKDTKYEDGILITNSKRKLLIRTGSYENMIDWKLAIVKAMEDSEYRGSKRYGSLYPIRSYNKVLVFVDGQDYFRKVYQKLKKAKSQVFITDWWLSPELYLKRPAIKNPKSKLIDILNTLAERGVAVYVHVYKEIASALTLNSKYTVETLRSSGKIRAIRHPKRSIYGGEFLWSHHEKVVCIDQEVAFLGGLDLCYGRMDNCKHKLKDTSNKPFWNGIDYSNVRVQDFDNVSDWKTDRIDRNKLPRMPWHDVGVMVRGDVAYDVSVNYTELWNHVMTDFYGFSAQSKDLLTPMRQNYRTPISKETLPETLPLVSEHSEQEAAKRLRKASMAKLAEKRVVVNSINEEIKRQEYSIRSTFTKHGKEGTCECQLLRSAGLWSYGLEEVDNSIQTAYLSLIDNAQHFIYIENQFFISNTGGGPVKNLICQKLVEKIIAKARNREPFKVIVVLPLLPGFPGEVDAGGAGVLRIQMHWQYQTISRGANSIYEQLKRCEFISNPSDYIRFYGLRTHDLIGDTPMTEIVYVHSKLMVVDDEYMIIGSANINDRSMMGDHDSEIAMVLTDSDKKDSILADQEIKVSKIVHDFRMKVFKEFLGECRDKDIIDPLSIAFAKEWEGTAQNNTWKYRELFACYPDDEIRNYAGLKSKKKVDVGLYNRVKKEIKGFLVEFPLEFLHDEDLTFSMLNVENLLPEKSFI